MSEMQVTVTGGSVRVASVAGQGPAGPPGSGGGGGGGTASEVEMTAASTGAQTMTITATTILSVYINGLRQPNGSYTYSSPTLTLPIGLLITTGDLISVLYI